MNKKFILSLIILSILLSTSCVSAGFFDSISDSSDLEVENVSVSPGGYGTYELKCALTPKKDFSYLEAFIVFYDSDDAVVEKASLVWNTNDPAKDQLIKVTGTAYVSSSEKPVRAEVFFTDGVSADESDAIYSENVTLS